MVADVNPPQDQAPPKPPKKRQKRIKAALAGVLAATTGQDWEQIAPQVGAKNGESLRRVMYRHGVTKSVIEASKARQPVSGTVTASVVSEATARIQDMLNEEVLDQIRAVRAVPLTYNELANDKQGRAGLVKTLAETYRAVNGNPDSVTFSFGASVQSSRPELETPQQIASQPVLDVESQSSQDSSQTVEPTIDAS